MDGGQQNGHGPFTAYVDETFNPSTKSKQGSPQKVMTSDLDTMLKTRDRKKIKGFVRTCALPAVDNLRCVLWWKLCCTVHKDTGSASIYDDTVNEVFGEGMFIQW